jgi:hypothetical protein
MVSQSSDDVDEAVDIRCGMEICWRKHVIRITEDPEFTGWLMDNAIVVDAESRIAVV